jgi:hypothetical protein
VVPGADEDAVPGTGVVGDGREVLVVVAKGHELVVVVLPGDGEDRNRDVAAQPGVG